MVATKQQAIALAVLSFLTIAAGIAVIVLFKFLFEALLSSGEKLPAVSLFWPYGMPVLVTGALGLLAAFLRNNVGIGIFMGVCIVCLVVEGALAVVAGLVLFILTAGNVKDCYMVNGVCQCRNDFTNVRFGSSGFGGEQCEDLVPLASASCALIIVSWLFMLAACIVSCMACCCGKREQSHAGVIFAQSPSAPPAAYEMQPGGPHPYGAPGQPYAGGYPGSHYQPQAQYPDSKPSQY